MTGYQHPVQLRLSGFTILELTIVLLIIGVVLAGGVVVTSAMLTRQQTDETEAKLETIEEALLNYRRAFKRIPCPGDIIIAPDAANFGMEAPDTGTCTGSTPAANFGPASSTVVAGGLPTATLNLDDDYAVDGWGRKFLYAVDTQFTAVDAFVSIPISDVTTGAITVNDTNDDARTTTGAYVIVSFGPDKHGSYGRLGGTVRFDADSTNTHQLENCDCDSNAVATAFDNVFVQRAAGNTPGALTDSFDDIVVFKTRQLLLSADD